ncbi:MAG: glycoside hydrolase family 99-like domain-containing protein [Methylovirgula sp.]
MKERAIVQSANLASLLMSDLEPIFWTPARLDKPSAWWGYVPFAFWITAACKPRVLVELGTHYGVSYAAFCEAVARARLGTRCYAVDTWAGDAHAGFYGDDIYNELKNFHDKRYASFSELLRKNFDDACGSFEDGTIDLLHIDGYHTYEAVRHDFETWRPKLSERAIVLFHDTNVRRDDFGVWRFFGELKKELPSFEFLHCYGLGVVTVGAEAPDPVRELCGLTEGDDVAAIRERFSYLGARWITESDENAKLATCVQQLEADVAQKDARIAERNAQIAAKDALMAEKDAQIVHKDAQIAEKHAQITAKDVQIAERNVLIAQKDAQIAQRDAQIMEKDAQIAEYLYHLNRINASPWWRFGMWFTRLVRTPLRLVASRRPPSVGAPSAAPAPNVSDRIKNEPAGSEYVPLFKGSPPNKKQVKLICFYLPQFHAIPENNAWWGEGFTEWTNVRAAQPQFKGHCQPRVPAELGYYNLLNPEVQRRQIELAKLYGVEGFCFYFYWFGGKRLLESPIENYLNDSTLDLPFCLCWANENWTRRWDGLDSEILIAQHHSPKDDLAFIQYVARYMVDPRYIRVNDKPLLIVYRPNLLPSPKETVKRWRTWCRENGIGEIYLAYTQSFEKVDPAKYDLDAAIEFPPNAFAVPNITEKFLTPSKDNTCAVYDWREFVDRSENYEKPKYKLFRSVCPAWDNTPRRKQNATILANSTPALYQRWLDNAIRDTRKRYANPDERLVFINAWNEWGEGAYLEPDTRYGYAHLEATRMALTRAYLKSHRAILDAATVKVAIIIHAYYLDVFSELIQFLGDVAARHKIFITTCPDHEAKVKSIMESTTFNYEIVVCENRGRDVLPFLSLMKQIDLNSYPFILKLHTKKSPHRSDGNKWRQQAYSCLAKPEQLDRIIGQMCSAPQIGLVGPRDHLIPLRTYYGANMRNINWLAARLGVEVDFEHDKFVAGTMFIARSEALEPILNLALGREDFEPEASQVDGTMAHAVERAFAYSALSAGFEVASVVEGDALSGIALRNAINYDFRFADRA